MLTIGAKEEFDIMDVSLSGLEQTPYPGILQQGKNFLGYPLPMAPAFVILNEKNRHAQIPQDDLPPEGFERIVLNYGKNIIFSDPTCATREGVAQALALAYVYAGNNKSLWGPEMLWEQETRVKQGLETEQFDRDEISLRLSQEAFATGVAIWFGITATSTDDDTDKIRIAHILSGGQETNVSRDIADGPYLQEKFNAMINTRALLLQAQDAQLASSEVNIAELFQQARTLQMDAAIPLGVYLVDSVMDMIDKITSRDDQQKTRKDIIQQLLKNPPQKIEELLRPELTIKKIAAELEFELPTSVIRPYMQLERQREAARTQESSYPFKNLRRTVHWAEKIHLRHDDSDAKEEVQVPYYYHGNFSPLITPAVIKEYAALMGDQFSEETPERVTQALFGIFEQMDSDVNLQRRGNEPPGYDRWHQAELRFIRFLNLEEPLKTNYYPGNISFADVARGLLASAQINSIEHPVFKSDKKTDEPLLHEQLLYEWFYSPNPQIAKMGETVDVGIPLDSIQRALTTDTLSGADGILPDIKDQEFLRSLADFIPDKRPASQIPQDQRVFLDTETPQDVTVVAEAEYGSIDVFADLPPQAIMTEFELTFPLIENPLKIAEVGGVDILFGVPTSTGPDPIITPRVLYNYYWSKNADPQGYRDAQSALFEPFEEIRKNQLLFLDQKYPQPFRNWLNEIQSLGFILFADKSEGEMSINYGFQLSHLIRAMSNTYDKLQTLNGFGPEARNYLNKVLADLALRIHEKEE